MDVKYNDVAGKYLQGLSSKGAFLTVGGETQNVMTIGWGSVGFYWSNPVLIVPVRVTRYTHDLLIQQKQFAVSLPKTGEMEEQLMYCGRQSGRDGDKFSACGLVKKNARSVNAPIIDGCEVHFECQVVYNHTMGIQEQMEKEVARNYAAGDFHTMFYGKIIHCY